MLVDRTPPEIVRERKETRMPRVLVVDDEAPIAETIAYNLQKHGFLIDTAADADECLLRIRSNPPDLLLLDVMLPSVSGLDICRWLHDE